MFGRLIYNLLFGWEELVVTSNQDQLKILASIFDHEKVAHKIFKLDTHSRFQEVEDDKTKYYVEDYKTKYYLDNHNTKYYLDVHKKDIRKAKKLMIHLD
ncbi:MAG: hypothetical protein JXR88_01100 [Clostridia bacterium]|nr:hypothetical protein [Clostridia bacterium]